MSLHVNNQYAKERGIGKNLSVAVRIVVLQEQVDMLAGDFNGAAWRRQSGNEQRRNSTIEQAVPTRTHQFRWAPGTRWYSM